MDFRLKTLEQTPYPGAESVDVMTLHQLRIFLAIAHSVTLTRASKQLGLAQPSLSKQLAALEESVGTQLFNRANNRMILTDAGQLLLRHAQNVLKEIDEAEAVFVHLPLASVRSFESPASTR